MGIDAYHDPGFGQLISWDIPLLDGYRSFFLSKKLALKGIEFSIVPWLIREKPDVLILHGYSQSTNLLALLVAKFLGVKVLIRGDTRLRPEGLPSNWRNWVKRKIFKLFDGFISIGSGNRAYYEALGAPADKIYFSPFSVRNSFFALEGEARQCARDLLREELGVPQDAIVVLVASKLVKQKRVGDVLEAFRRIATELPNLWLFIAGSGPEQISLQRASTEMTQVRFLGFKNQSELPQLFAASDVFVLPAENESWGLVVNEVMAAGLPVVVTNDVGAAPDLVDGKDSGFVYPVGDVGRLAEVLQALAKDQLLRKRMGSNGKMLISSWDESNAAAGIERAVFACLPAVGRSG